VFLALAIFLPTFRSAPAAATGGGAGPGAPAEIGANLVAIASRPRPWARSPASLLTAVLAAPLLMWAPGLAVSVALGFAYSFVNAAARPSLIATMAEVPGEVRGAVFGLTVTMASVGWLLAGSVGAALVAAGGFAGLGIFCSLLALAGAVLALASTMAVRGRRREAGQESGQQRPVHSAPCSGADHRPCPLRPLFPRSCGPPASQSSAPATAPPARAARCCATWSSPATAAVSFR
jgi:hypothetical protein